MIDFLSLRNFQRHDTLDVDLDPALNVLVGPNDSGKSSALRAFLWVATNRPQGDSFVRHGASKCSVRVKVDGHRITRTRGRDQNEYKLDGQVLKAFGAGVPPEVASLLNLSDAAYANQHTGSLFWFALSAGEVSRELNRVVRLDLIDDALAYLAAELRKARATVDVCTGRLVDTKATRKELAWVPGMEAMFTKLVNIGNKLEEKRLESTRSAELLEQGKRYQETARNAATLAQGVANGVAKLQDIWDRSMKIGDAAWEAVNLEGRLRAALENVKHCNTERDRAEAELAKASQGRCPVCGRER